MNIELLLRKRNDSVTRIQIQLIKKCKLQINRLTKQCHSKSYDRVAMNVGIVSESVTTNRNNGDDERIKKHYEIMNIELLLRKRNDSVTRIQIHCE